MKVIKSQNKINQKKLEEIFCEYLGKKDGTKFVKEFITDKILYAAVSSKNFYIYSYDFTLTRELIDILKSNLNIDEKMFSEEVEKTLKNQEFIYVEVDEDYEYGIFYKENKNIEINEDNTIKIIETFPNFDVIFDVIGDKDNSEISEKDKDKVLSLYENYINEYYKEQNIDTTYQIGGNAIINIQWGQEDLIGFFHGGYGDDGGLYVTASNGKVFAQVDMY